MQMRENIANWFKYTHEDSIEEQYQEKTKISRVTDEGWNSQ